MYICDSLSCAASDPLWANEAKSTSFTVRNFTLPNFCTNALRSSNAEDAVSNGKAFRMITGPLWNSCVSMSDSVNVRLEASTVWNWHLSDCFY